MSDLIFSKGVNFLKAEPKLINLAQEFYSKSVDELKIPIIFTCVDRSLTTQIALYCQGRMAINDVNKIRQRLGLYLIDNSDDSKVTWSLNSYHVVDDKRLLSRAFDIAILVNGQPSWSESLNADYLKLAEMGKSIGLTPGAFWENPDMPHYQIEV